MLIRESTLRRIIREEAYRSLREETAPPAITPGGTSDQWKGLSSSVSNFAAAFSTEVPGGGGPKLLAAVKDLIAKGKNSKFAALAVAPPATVNNAPAISNGEIGRLVCLMASLADGKPYTDYLSAQTILTGTSTMQDAVSPAVIKALGGRDTNSTSMIDNIKMLGSAQPPGYTAPAQKPQINVSENLKAVANGTQVLKIGSKGAAVKDIQNMINSITPGAVTVDGDYGKATYDAVIAYQRAKNLKVVDGKVGRETLSSMFGQRASPTGAAPAGGAYIAPADVIGSKPTQTESRRIRRY